MDSIKVIEDASDGVFYFYMGISPEEALRTAFAQVVRKDWNTWDYDTKYTGPIERDSAGYHFRGFTAVVEA